MMLENKLLNDERLELTVVISRKNLQVNTNLHKMQSERKTSKLTVWFHLFGGYLHRLYKYVYTQYVLISKGPISKTSQISGFFKQWLVKFSKLSNNLFCSRFLSNPLVNFFNLSKSKLLLCVWQNAIMCKTLKRFNVSW